jgi:hypothetical protein
VPAAQVFRLDFASPKRDLALAGGAVATTERFHRARLEPIGRGNRGAAGACAAARPAAARVSQADAARALGACLRTLSSA